MTKCINCGAEIKWVVMSGGKEMPLDALPCNDGLIVEGDDDLLAQEDDAAPAPLPLKLHGGRRA